MKKTNKNIAPRVVSMQF